jgi:hypothetical protein
LPGNETGRTVMREGTTKDTKSAKTLPANGKEGKMGDGGAVARGREVRFGGAGHVSATAFLDRRLHEKQQELEAVLDDDDATEPKKNEALHELGELAAFQRRHAMRSRGNAERLVRTVRVAVTRLHAKDEKRDATLMELGIDQKRLQAVAKREVIFRQEPTTLAGRKDGVHLN